MDLSALRRAYTGHVPALMGARGGSAVLVPLADTADGPSLLYEIRSAAVRQPGEVCFPGGKTEHGETAVQCALRETWEELAIPPEAVEVIGEMDFLHIRAGSLLRPVLGRVDSAALDAMSPLKVLGRGYSIARNENGTLIASVKDAAPGERLELRLSDGSLACRVEERKCL